MQGSQLKPGAALVHPARPTCPLPLLAKGLVSPPLCSRLPGYGEGGLPLLLLAHATITTLRVSMRLSPCAVHSEADPKISVCEAAIAVHLSKSVPETLHSLCAACQIHLSALHIKFRGLASGSRHCPYLYFPSPVTVEGVPLRIRPENSSIWDYLKSVVAACWAKFGGILRDFSVPTFSLDGQVFRVEFDSKRVDSSRTIVGIGCKDGVVLLLPEANRIT